MSNANFAKAVAFFFLEEHGDCAIAQGNSMVPFIRDGQTVALDRTIGPLRCGQCYFFYYQDRLLLHRLVYLGNGGLVFMGDNSDTIEIVEQANLIGRLGYNRGRLLGKVITAINRMYYILHRRFPLRIVCRVRKRLIKTALVLFAGTIP